MVTPKVRRIAAMYWDQVINNAKIAKTGLVEVNTCLGSIRAGLLIIEQLHQLPEALAVPMGELSSEYAGLEDGHGVSDDPEYVEGIGRVSKRK